MLRFTASGTTARSKLRKVASNTLSGICTVSKANPLASIARWICGCLCPVNPTNRTFRAFFAWSSASTTPPLAKCRSGSVS